MIESTGFRSRIWLWFFTLASLCIQAEVDTFQANVHQGLGDFSLALKHVIAAIDRTPVVFLAQASRGGCHSRLAPQHRP